MFSSRSQGPWTGQERKWGEGAIFSEHLLGAEGFNAFPLISQPPSETGGIIASMSSDLPRITQLGKDQVRVRVESRTICPITHANLSEELRVYGLCWVVIRASSTRGGGASCPGGSDQGEPSVSGKKMGRLWWAFLAGMWEVAGDKSRGWAQRVQTQVLTVGGCSYLSQKPGSHPFVHSFIHSFLEKYIKHIELLRHIIHSHHKLVLKV